MDFKSTIKTTRRTAIASLLALGLGLGAFSTVHAQTEIKLAHVGNPGSLFEASANEFARLANAKLGDKAKVVVFGSSQLGGDKAVIQKLKLGTIDLAILSTVMSSEVDLFGIFEMPYLVADRGHMKRIEETIFWESLAPAAEKKGLKILAVWENGYRHITNNTRPIVTPDDLKGIKLRTPKGKWRVKMFQTYGANPSPMAFSEVFTALQTGVMDGQENPLVQIYSAKFQEVQKYLSLSKHVYGPAYLASGTRKFATYSPEVQQALESAARETQAFVYASAEKSEVELLAKMKAAGIQVNEVDSAAFVDASGTIYEEFGKEVPGASELIIKAQALRQ